MGGCRTSKKTTQILKTEKKVEKIVIRPKGITTFVISLDEMLSLNKKEVILFENVTNGISQKISKTPNGELVFVSEVDERVVQDVKEVEAISESKEEKIKGISFFWVGVSVFILLLFSFVIFLIKKKVKLWI